MRWKCEDLCVERHTSYSYNNNAAVGGPYHAMPHRKGRGRQQKSNLLTLLQKRHAAELLAPRQDRSLVPRMRKRENISFRSVRERSLSKITASIGCSAYSSRRSSSCTPFLRMVLARLRTPSPKQSWFVELHIARLCLER